MNSKNLFANSFDPDPDRQIWIQTDVSLKYFFKKLIFKRSQWSTVTQQQNHEMLQVKIWMVLFSIGCLILRVEITEQKE